MTMQNLSYIDSHCHLDDDKFNEDRDIVIERAQEAGIKLIVNIGTDQQTNEAAIALAKKYPGYIYHTVGAHPELADAFDHRQLKAVLSQVKNSQPHAVGEIGLDYFHQSDKTKQRHLFTAMLEIACERHLPVVIHNREADEDMLAVLREHAKETSILLHSYLSGPDYVEKFLELNCLFGIGGPITFKSAKADPHREAVQLIPIERILLETDAPYLTPHPHRGRRNEPAFCLMTAEKIAEIKGMELHQVAEQTTANTQAFFNISF